VAGLEVDTAFPGIDGLVIEIGIARCLLVEVPDRGGAHLSRPGQLDAEVVQEPVPGRREHAAGRVLNGQVAIDPVVAAADDEDQALQRLVLEFRHDGSVPQGEVVADGAQIESGSAAATAATTTTAAA